MMTRESSEKCMEPSAQLGIIYRTYLRWYLDNAQGVCGGSWSEWLGESSDSNIRSCAQGQWILITAWDYNHQKAEERRCEIDEARPRFHEAALEDAQILQKVQGEIICCISCCHNPRHLRRNESLEINPRREIRDWKILDLREVRKDCEVHL